MDELYALKEMLCKELKEYGEKGEMSAGALEIVDKLAHAVKNIDRIIENYDEEYSSAGGGGGSNRGGGSYRSYRGGSYEGNMGGGSYARGGRGGSRRGGQSRYSREGGYSRHGDMVEQLEELMQDAPNQRIRQEIEKLVDKVEQMQ